MAGGRNVGMSEGEFKTWVRDAFKRAGIWFEAYEPRRGGGVGIPDTQILIEGVLYPLELKVCELGRSKFGKVDDEIIWSKDVRPDQIGWHERFKSAGGWSAFIIGFGVTHLRPDRIFLAELQDILEWKKGIPVYKTYEVPVWQMTHKEKAARHIVSICENLRG